MVEVAVGVPVPSAVMVIAAVILMTGNLLDPRSGKACCTTTLLPGLNLGQQVVIVEQVASGQEIQAILRDSALGILWQMA